MFSVVTPNTDRTLLSLAEAKAAFDSTGLTDDQVNTLIGRVSSAITRACRVTADGATPPTLRLEPVSDAYRLKCRQTNLVLSRRPVTTVDSIVENGATLAADAYEIEKASGMLKRLSADCEIYWPHGKIVVVYSAGWATVPDDLKTAAAKLLKSLWAEDQKSDPSLRRERVIVPGVREKDQEWWVGPKDDPLIPTEIMELLEPYRQVVVG